jgi:uncharacterized protein YbjT (DUF2867 family)
VKTTSPIVSSRVLVTGASGSIGTVVAAQLRDAGVPVRALSRNPHSGNLPDGIDVVRGDLTAPETLDQALSDVAAVFLVWVAPLATAADVIARIASRARRVVFLSAPIHTAHPFFQQPNPVRIIHATIEDLIMKSGAAWTMVRPAPFALNCRNWWAQQIRTGDVVRWFHGAAATAPVHEQDIAAVAVRALCEDQHEGRDYILTGPQSLTQREQVAIIGDAIGRTLRFDELPPDIARRQLVDSGWPAFAVDMLLSAYGAAVDRPALVTSAIEAVTGTPARTFPQWAADHAADFVTR